MIPSLADHCQCAAFALVAAATDLRFLNIREPYSTSSRHLARWTPLIPFSPANGIMQRIVLGNLPRKVI